MADEFQVNGIDFYERGYFGCPTPPVNTKFPKEPNTKPWLAWIITFDEAKKGNFVNVPRLLELYDDSPSYVFQYVCHVLLGDAGPAFCFPKLIHTIESDWDSSLILDCCRALASRGLLADVPILLKAYKALSELKDAKILPIWIADIIDTETSEVPRPDELPSLDSYDTVVMTRYHELVNSLGSEQIYLFKGKIFGVERLAKQILEELNKPSFRMIFRRKFEASTGVDCTNFYKDHEIQPLIASEIVERFLESSEIDKYKDGVRYFFGHRIPD